MSIFHNGTNSFISGATTCGDLHLMNLDDGQDIIFSQAPTLTFSPPPFNWRIRGANENDAYATVQTHSAVVMDETKPAVATSITLLAATPFYSVTSDVTVGGFPYSDQTTALTLPAWEEGLWFRIGYKALGAGPSPLGRAQITIEASGSELIAYTGGGESAGSLMIAESERSGPVYGICEAYATETFADASNSAKVEVWIIQTGDRTAIQQ